MQTATQPNSQRPRLATTRLGELLVHDCDQPHPANESKHPYSTDALDESLTWPAAVEFAVILAGCVLATGRAKLRIESGSDAAEHKHLANLSQVDGHVEEAAT